MAQGKKTCARCARTINISNYYASNNENHFDPEHERRLFPRCKACATSIVDPYKPSTYRPLLEELDVVHDVDLWENTVKKYADERGVCSGTKVVGAYLGSVKLGQYKDLRWVDTEARAAEKSHREAVAQAQSEAHRLRFQNAFGSGAAAAQANIDRSLLTEEEIAIIFNAPKPSEPALLVETPDGFEDGSRAHIAVSSSSVQRGTLSAEDAAYLSSKWGAIYVEQELLYMERLYHDMCSSYEITTASHFDYLQKICKVSLKCEAALDVNDFEAYNKVARIYDMLMKSAKFTAAQNKSESSLQEESLARAILLMEEHGSIPLPDLDVARDEIDFVMKDMMRYTKRLIMEEAGLGNSIESAILSMQRIEAETDEEILEELPTYEEVPAHDEY